MRHDLRMGCFSLALAQFVTDEVVPICDRLLSQRTRRDNAASGVSSNRGCGMGPELVRMGQ